MARSNTFVTAGYLLLMLLSLGGLAAGIYFLILYFTQSQSGSIYNVTLEKLGGGLAGWFLKFTIDSKGPCMKDCNPSITYLSFQGHLAGSAPINITPIPEFHSLVSNGPNSWDAVIVLPDEQIFEEGSVTASILGKVGTATPYFSGIVAPVY